MGKSLLFRRQAESASKVKLLWNERLASEAISGPVSDLTAPPAGFEHLTGDLLRRLPWAIRRKILDHAIDPVTDYFFRHYFGWECTFSWSCDGEDCDRLAEYDGAHTNDYGLPLCELAQLPDERLQLEALLVTIEKTTIDLWSECAARGVYKWLANIDFSLLQGDTSYQTGFDAVKSLRFSSFSCSALVTHPNILLMQSCKNLTTLRIVLERYDIEGRVATARLAGSNSPLHAVIRDVYHLDGVIECKGLERLELAYSVGTNRSHESAKMQCREIGLRELKKWFKAEYKKRGRKVIVAIVAQHKWSTIDEKWNESGALA